ncbi:MAG: hypothetical protein J7501_02550 [Bdellovibrio sp.]|nr:hypothetical protein [Bdellovibrio sp.]
MHPIKQAFMMYKENWKESILLGVAATVFTFFSQIVPTIGALLISVGLLVFQELANMRLQKGRWQRDLTHLQKDWVSWVITAVILMPTGILMGSAFGVLHSPQDWWQTIPASFGLFMLGVFFYLILTHGLNLQLERSEGIAKALDHAALGAVRNLRLYFPTVVWISLALIVASFLRGYGLILALPFMFYSCFYLYIEMKNKKAFEPKEKGT